MSSKLPKHWRTAEPGRWETPRSTCCESLPGFRATGETFANATCRRKPSRSAPEFQQGLLRRTGNRRAHPLARQRAPQVHRIRGRRTCARAWDQRFKSTAKTLVKSPASASLPSKDGERTVALGYIRARTRYAGQAGASRRRRGYRDQSAVCRSFQPRLSLKEKNYA